MALPGADVVVMPLEWQAWEKELAVHPDSEWVAFLVRGIRYGFRLGHDQTKGPVQCRRRFMYKTLEHKDVVSYYLEE